MLQSLLGRTLDQKFNPNSPEMKSLHTIDGGGGDSPPTQREISMPRINFQQQLVALKDKLLAMAALSQQALEFSVEAYTTRDLALANHVHEIEAAINAAETSVDEMAYELLAKEQPMAIDLRFILSVIKINGDLERIGDQATNIASRALAVIDKPQIALPIDIEVMGAKVGVMIRSAIQALLEADDAQAESVLAMDDEIDDMNRTIHAELIETMEQHSESADQALNAIIISRNLERAADHATNIAEDVIFWVRGSDVRHKLSQLQIAS
jgi:phosphate transport system protein